MLFSDNCENFSCSTAYYLDACFAVHSHGRLAVLPGRPFNVFSTRPRRLTYYSVVVIITVVVVYNIYCCVP